MISDAEFNAWLKDDNRERVVLVEAKYYDTVEKTRYLSSHGFVSGPSDTPANQVYDDIIDRVPALTSDIDLLFGVGSFFITNDGSLDSWVDDAWSGRDFIVYLGDATWSRDDFRQIASLVTDSLDIQSNDALVFSVRNKRDKLNINVQSTHFDAGDADGKPKPICCGQVFNITPVLIDKAAHKYQIHDGPIEAITDVRVKGVTTAFTADLAAGTFTLSAKPTGRVTCDAKGAKPSVYLYKPADIVQYLVEREALTTPEIDAASFSDFNALCPQTVGVYLSSRENLNKVITDLLQSVGGHWLFDRNGLLKLWRLEAPTASAVAEFDADDVADDAFTFLKGELPVARVSLGYQKNYTVQSSVDDTVEEDDRVIYADKSSVSTADNVGIKTAYPLANEPDTDITLLALQAESDAEAARRLTLSAVHRKFFKAVFYTGPFQINLGDEIKVSYPRFGFENGQYAIVTGLEEMLTDNTIEVSFWL
jgi:hypothetical protein